MKFDLLIRNVHLLTMCGDEAESTRLNGALGCTNGKIVWVGKECDLPVSSSATEVVDGEGGWLLPGLIDCHTHLVYAGDRTHEFEARLKGKSYQEIAAEGGGILSTVRDSRQR
jgi:imidazolonepropionase